MKKLQLNIFPVTCLILLLFLSFGSVQNLNAQEAEIEKKKARISLDYFSFNNEEFQLVATVKSKIDGFYQLINGVKISFYKDSISEVSMIGSELTDNKGEARLILDMDKDTAVLFNYVAVLANEPEFKDANKKLKVKKATLELTTEEIDSLRMAKIIVRSPDDSVGNMVPVGDVDVGLFVNRLFGLMSVTDGSKETDKNGLVIFEFPQNIPGDENGNIPIIARVTDHKHFGNLEFEKTVPWGFLSDISDESDQEKKVWLSSASINTPRVLMFIVTIMLLGVLGIIFYIIYQLIQISNLGLKEGAE